ncbi:MAG: hypothetical protein M0R70_06225 [Nitrospirae bacterium]|nr:hypothetical protein [Nitrospirota bacterium]
MQSKVASKTVWWVLLFSLFLMGAESGEQDGEERGKLLEQQKQLSASIEKLKREQAYLVFQSAMYASDSKYLIINISAKTGQLKYKNRILKDFSFTLVSGRVRRLTRGALTLTQKIEGIRGKNLLVFEKSLVLQGKYAPAVELETRIPRFSLSKKDFRSVYYAIEAGAKAYILF